MKPRSLYLDSSALIKLVFDEEETAALEDFLSEHRLRLSSSLARVEVMRAARTVSDELVSRHADAVLGAIELIAPDAALLADAARIDPLTLRSLDAVHLATAVALADDIEGMVVYDRRLADAARHAGLTVWSPS
ncbi:MAG TPA: type II toxin-antitoxin system VapC family toxin [Vicinamibacterales bacterium]|nr:type II toxin-antitoxin system VapC family toxin [Vicinamibacterales bacterium]